MNSKRIPLFSLVVLTLALAACGGGDDASESTSGAAAEAAAPAAPHPWDLFVERQIEAHLEAHPAWAVVQGRHEYDGILPDWSEYGLQDEARRLHAARDEAMAFTDANLSPLQR